MNSGRVGIFLCCVPAIFANGCDPCVEVTCDPNEVCVDGTCETVFETCDDDTDDDCAPGEFCVDGRCGDTCNTSDDCECDSDADCDDQDACTTDLCAGDVCLNLPIPCNTADTCPDGCNVACNALFSWCSNSIDPCGGLCEPNEFCIDGDCVECLVDADCDDQDPCTDNTCADRGCSYFLIFCDDATDCPAGCNCIAAGICD